MTPVPQGPFDTYGWWPSGVHHHGMAIAHGELLLSQKDSTMTKTRFSTVVGMGLLASSLFLLPMATSTFAQTTTPHRRRGWSKHAPSPTGPAYGACSDWRASWG